MEKCTQLTAAQVMEIILYKYYTTSLYFPPSYCADDYSNALSCGILSHMIIQMLKNHMALKAH